MTYVGEAGQVSARYRPVADVPALTTRSGVSRRLVAPGSVTNGQFGLFEWNMPPHAERYFEEVAEIDASGRTLSYDEWTELYARHDQYRAG